MSSFKNNLSKINKKTELFLWIIFTLSLSIFFLLIASIFLNTNNSEIKPVIKKEAITKHYDVPIGNSYYFGTSNPTITIITFSDFNCPVCKKIAPILKSVYLKNSSLIKIVHKDFPVITEDSITLSLIARCAGEQNSFWDAYEFLFKNQKEIDITNLSTIASNLSISPKLFTDCVSSQKYLNDIKRDSLLAERLKVKGTPTLFINGYKLSGDISEETLEKIINKFKNNKN